MFTPCETAVLTQLKRCSPSWISESLRLKRWGPDVEGRSCQGWIRFCLQLWTEMFQALGSFQGGQLPAGSSDSWICQDGQSAAFPPLLSSSFLSLPNHCHLPSCFPLLDQHKTLNQNCLPLSLFTRPPARDAARGRDAERQAGLGEDSWFYCLVTLWPWTSSLTSWCPYFLISKIRIIAASWFSVFVKI